MKRPLMICTAILTSGALLAGCTGGTTSAATVATTQTATSTVQSDLAPDAVMADNADYTVVNTDEWDESDAVDLVLDGDTVTITDAGVYRLSGTLDGQVVVDAPEDALVVLILDGVEITNSEGPAIEVRTADDVAIHLAEGSTNSVSDASSYADDAEANAAIYSEADLTISGAGSLTVEGNGNDGITSKDDLVILGGTLDVTAADDALRGKDALVIEGGSLNLTATSGDGLKSDGDEGDEEIDWSRGYIYVSGGTITITAGDDGLQAFTDTVITGGTVTAAVTDDGVKGEVTVSIGDGADAPKVTVTESTEGIEAANIGISGGTIDVTASDDAINASGNAELQALINGVDYVDDGSDEFTDTGERLEISGGFVTVDAEGDGLDSNGSLTISGGDVVVNGPVTGGNGSLDADGEITVTGGSLTAFGPGDMEQTPGTDGQGWVKVSAAVAAGDVLAVVDSSGITVAEFTAEKNASSVIYSSSEIATGETYSVVVDGQELGSAVAGEGGMAGGPGGGPGSGGSGGFGGFGGGFPGMGEGMPPEMTGDMPQR